MSRRTLVVPLALAFALHGAAPLVAQTLPNQGSGDPVIPRTAASTPAGNDTTGYWQQRADYRIVATLDESKGVVRATGILHYTNNSPDTLRELWLHQHLNAFRPGSRWSATDEKEGRTRFQSLADPDHAFERFLTAPRVGNVAVVAEYPLAPDSSVVRLALPTPLRPGASTEVRMIWEARPSTLVRRQGRRDRSFDFAQWYPRVAVYDRHGWKPNALVPAGEFYGEFGTFEVTLHLPDDQVVGATGVPIAGDPGWARVAVNNARPLLQRQAYAGRRPPEPRAPGVVLDPEPLPPGYRSVTFRAENVHHFAWSASPGFVYEGGSYVRPSAALRDGVPVWDTVAVHVLYRGDADAFCAAAPVPATATYEQRLRAQAQCVVQAKTGWEDGAALRNGLTTLAWLEKVFGPYPYPQMTILKRLDSGGTEFPMMMQNGSNSASLVTHEGGHIYVHGILANNEWQSGWLDEGFTSYVTSWQTGNVRAVIADAIGWLGEADPSQPSDSLLAARRRSKDATSRERATVIAAGRLDPIGTRGDAFRNFSTYNTAVYSRAEDMYAALHDLLGDAVFRAVLRDYYARWAFRHVDRWALQGSAERVSGRSLDWFFEQWVHRVGTIDYALSNAESEPIPGGWRTTVTLQQVGAYRHAMPVGVRTAEGWTVVRGDPLAPTQRVVIETVLRPEAVWLDPYGSTESVSGPYRLPLR